MNTFRTGPHRDTERLLDGIGISYDSEYAVGPYRLDLYLGEWHLAIEVDGPDHRTAKDAARDIVMMDHYGIPTFRIPLERLRNETARLALRQDIIEFIETHADTVKQRLSIFNEA